MINIEEIKEKNWPLISKIYQAGIETNIATFQTACPTYPEWDSSHMKVCRIMLINDESIVGWAALSPVSCRYAYSGVAEVSIYVDMEFKRKGFGERLLSDLTRRSAENNIWMLQANIIKDNIASIQLHSKCGFRLVGYRSKIARDRFGKWHDVVLMEKRDNNIY